MTDKKLDTALPRRMHWLDNLRTFMVFLVVVLHAGLVYESSGLAASFWIVDDPSTNDLSGIFNLILDIFVMPTMFFISGFFAPSSLDRRTGRTFLGSRFKRLMVPWFVAVLTLIPIYKVIFLYSRNLPQERWSTYFHWSNGIWGQNWLWFLPVLFLFHILYLLLYRATETLAHRGCKAWRLLEAFESLRLPEKDNLESTKDSKLLKESSRVRCPHLPTARELLTLCIVGALCYRLRTFDSPREGKALYIAASCTAWIPVNLYLALVIYPLISPGHHVFSEIADALLIRLTFLLSLLCLLYLSIDTFRRYMDRQGRVSRELSRSSYNVYIIRTIVMGGIALALLNAAIPSLVKHLVLAVLTYCASSSMIYAYRKVRVQNVFMQRVQYDKA